MSELQLHTVTFGSIFESTPEGLFRMDRIRRTEEERRRGLSEVERALEDILREAEERMILFGNSTPGTPGDLGHLSE